MISGEFDKFCMDSLKLALLGYSAIKGIAGIFATIKSFLAIFGIGGSAATVAATMDTVSTAATGLSTALTGFAAAATVVGSYKLLTGHLEELFSAFGKSTDQGERLEKRYEGLDGAARFAKDGIDTLKNGIEGYGFAADNCVGTGVALKRQCRISEMAQSLQPSTWQNSRTDSASRMKTWKC